MPRSFDSHKLAETMEPFLPLEGFHPIDWLADERNVALTDGEGSFALFEFVKPGIYYGHYFFQKRGRDAVQLSHDLLGEIFETARVVVGLTPVEKKAARWMSRKVGFKSHGEVDTDQGRHEMFILTKNEYELKDDCNG